MKSYASIFGRGVKCEEQNNIIHPEIYPFTRYPEISILFSKLLTKLKNISNTNYWAQSTLNIERGARLLPLQCSYLSSYG